MTDEPTALPPRLFAPYHTVLYVEPKSGELRNGPNGSSPANARLQCNGAEGRIVYAAEGINRPIVCSADRSQALDDRSPRLGQYSRSCRSTGNGSRSRRMIGSFPRIRRMGPSPSARKYAMLGRISCRPIHLRPDLFPAARRNKPLLASVLAAWKLVTVMSLVLHAPSNERPAVLERITFTGLATRHFRGRFLA